MSENATAIFEQARRERGEELLKRENRLYEAARDHLNGNQPGSRERVGSIIPMTTESEDDFIYEVIRSGQPTLWGVCSRANSRREFFESSQEAMLCWISMQHNRASSTAHRWAWSIIVHPAE